MPAPRVAKLPVGTLAKLSRSMREDLGVSNLPHGFINELPADVVQYIVARMTVDPMTLVHHIGRAAPTCKVVSVAARDALWEQRFSDEVVVVPIPGHPHPLNCVDATFRALLRGVPQRLSQQNKKTLRDVLRSELLRDNTTGLLPLFRELARHGSIFYLGMLMDSFEDNALVRLDEADILERRHGYSYYRLRTALMEASGEGYVAVVEMLLAAGAEVNANHGEALSRASEKGHLPSKSCRRCSPPAETQTPAAVPAGRR